MPILKCPNAENIGMDIERERATHVKTLFPVSLWLEGGQVQWGGPLFLFFFLFFSGKRGGARCKRCVQYVCQGQVRLGYYWRVGFSLGR